MADAWATIRDNLPADWSLLELCRMEPGSGRDAWYASAGNYRQRGWDGQEVVEATGKTAVRALANLGLHLAARKGRLGHPPSDAALPPKPPRIREPQLLYRSPDIRQPAMAGWGSEDLEEAL